MTRAFSGDVDNPLDPLINLARKTFSYAFPSFDERKENWRKKCGCEDTDYPEILAVSKQPVKCVCMITEYETDEAPGGDDYTTVYNTFKDIFILNINSAQKTLSLHIRLSYQWEDQRIYATSPDNKTEIPFAGVSPKQELEIWQPSRSCQLCVHDEEEMAFSKIEFLLDGPLNQNTTFVSAILSWRVTLTCNLDFENFPFDDQFCKFRINSKDSGELREILYGHENRSIMQLPNVDTFSAIAKVVGTHITDDNITGEIGFDIEMRRQIRPYLLEYYIPCLGIVIISSISFAIPLYAIPGRVALVVTLLLTLINIFTQQQVSG